RARERAPPGLPRGGAGLRDRLPARRLRRQGGAAAQGVRGADADRGARRRGRGRARPGDSSLTIYDTGMPDDFMPIEGWDHLELWVGNAKQSAYFYERAFGFTQVAYAGPETGVRDRAAYVLEQGDVRLVLSSALREDHEISRHVVRHGDGVRDIALTVPDA